ncbi:MAG: cysteine hydrolase family protein [Chloroflexi bacterium]|nr:cysteine hydrolase family protein [Chloroflexota bacterium]
MLSLEQRFDPKHTALIVVDVQNDFCHPEGACVRAVNADVSDIEAAMPPLRKLLAAARAAGVFVVFIRSLYDDQYLTDALREHYERRGYRDILQSGSWGAEFYGGVQPEPGRDEIVVTKHRFDAFRKTSLDAELRKRGIESVICCGFTTSTCVESTTRDALFHDYHTAIARDAVAEFDRDLHEGTLKIIRRSFGLTPTVDEIVAVWPASSAGRETAAAASARESTA